MSVARTFRGPGGPFRATVTPPGDKSMSHRALILAAMAPGDSRLRGLGPGADVGSTVWCLRQFGIEITPATTPEMVRSRGVEAWRQVDTPLDAANSGTTVRLLAGAVAARPFTTRFTGDPSLRRRPMRRLIDPLSSLGAVVTVSRAGTLPVSVTGGPLLGTVMWLPEASAQVRTAFALAAVQAEGVSTLDSPPGFRDHTERWLQALGRGRRQGATGFEVHPGPLPPLDITVPGDPSSAAFLWTAAAMTEAEVTTPGVSLNPGRTGLLDVIATMGANVQATVTHDVLGDPVGTVTVRGPVHTGMRVSGELTVRALDELPLVGLLGTVAAGETVVADAAELRLKESDRIAATVRLITTLGGTAEPSPDGFRISKSSLRSGAYYAGGDHRMAMAGAVAATVAGTVTVVGMEAAAVSWPTFAETLEQAWSSQ